MSTYSPTRTPPGGVAGTLPWAAASAAAHLVLVVLSGMTQIARPVQGEGFRPDPVPPRQLEASVWLNPGPRFDAARTPEAITPFPILEARFERDLPTSSPWPDRVSPVASSGKPVPSLDPRALRGVRRHPSEGQGAILAALRWLARHQSADGTWKAVLACKECRPNPGNDGYRTGVTALALLAFLRAGYRSDATASFDGRAFGEVVDAAQQALIAAEDPDGCIGPREGKFLYNHAIATLALAESGDRPTVSRAARFLINAQNPGQGWRYGVRPGENDTSVTGWAVLALLAAERSLGTRFDSRGPLAWFDAVTEEAYGRVGYLYRDTGKITTPGPNEHFDRHETLTAMTALVRRALEGPRAPHPYAVDLLTRDTPEWDPVRVDFVYWHFGTAAVLAIDAPGGDAGKGWKEAARHALLPHQRTSGCADGSWDPVDRWSDEGGRVYATAINTLTLLLLSP